VNNLEIIDYFLTAEEHLEIKSFLIGKAGNFPWYYNDDVVFETTEDHLYNFQFTHTFYSNYSFVSEYYRLLDPLIKKLNPASILRIKANLSTNTKECVQRELHTDTHKVMGKTAIYYVNTNNGYTYFDDGAIVASIENRLVKFDNTILHAGTTSSNTKVRCVININYTEWNNK